MTAAMLPVWGYSIHKIKTEIPKSKMPLLGIGAAFSFLGMMFNVPLPGGTTGHAVGGTLIAILTGSPAAGCISVSIALLIQALLFWRWRNPCVWCKLFQHGIYIAVSGIFPVQASFEENRYA